MQSWVVAPNWEELRAAAPDAHLQPPQYNHKFHPCEQHKQPQKSCNMSFASVKITLIFSFLKMSLKIKNRILAWNFLCFKSNISRDFVLEGFQESIIFQRIFFGFLWKISQILFVVNGVACVQKSKRVEICTSSIECRAQDMIIAKALKPFLVVVELNYHAQLKFLFYNNISTLIVQHKSSKFSLAKFHLSMQRFPFRSHLDPCSLCWSLSLLLRNRLVLNTNK